MHPVMLPPAIIPLHCPDRYPATRCLLLLRATGSCSSDQKNGRAGLGPTFQIIHHFTLNFPTIQPMNFPICLPENCFTVTPLLPSPSWPAAQPGQACLPKSPGTNQVLVPGLGRPRRRSLGMASPEPALSWSISIPGDQYTPDRHPGRSAVCHPSDRSYGERSSVARCPTPQGIGFVTC